MITISDEIVSQSGLDEQKFKIKLVVLMYEANLMTLTQAAMFAHISKYEMQHQLGVRGVKIRWDEDYKHQKGTREGGGLIVHYMSDDFNAPLDDFNAYM